MDVKVVIKNAGTLNVVSDSYNNERMILNYIKDDLEKRGFKSEVGKRGPKKRVQPEPVKE